MFTELVELDLIRKDLEKYADVSVLTKVSDSSKTLPIYGITLGNPDPRTPVLGVVAGIHGLEKIGTWVCLSFLKNLAQRLPWDTLLQAQLKQMRYFFIPLANPIGMMNGSRSNGNGVDLMRNAPLTSKEATFLVGGHHYSPHLPWYRGNLKQTVEGMESESKAILDFVEKQTQDSPCSIILDLHSGFGLQDQLWFPYAKSKELYPQLPEIFSLFQLFDRVLPEHIYRFEPQAKNYTTHGDLWDYLIQKYEMSGRLNENILIPLTLEMGSWNWIKKNPIQLFSFLGPFNPIKPHRQRRTMRRHLPLFDFLGRALVSHPAWTTLPPLQRSSYMDLAIQKWY